MAGPRLQRPQHGDRLLPHVPAHLQLHHPAALHRHHPLELQRAERQVPGLGQHHFGAGAALVPALLCGAGPTLVPALLWCRHYFVVPALLVCQH